jgi:hypothetical protein
VLKKVARERKGVPQRLKPHCKYDVCGTAEAMPLSKTAEAVPLSKTYFFSTLASQSL